MKDWTETGVTVKKDFDTDFENLKSDLANFGLARTVENWNICRQNAKYIYDRKVIDMLDASGFIVNWLNK